MYSKARQRERATRTFKLALVAAVSLVGLAPSGCGSEPSPLGDPLIEARRLATRSSDGEVVGRWLFAELVAPGGDPAGATHARTALDALTPKRHGVYASIARAIDDESHGHLVLASNEFLEAIDAAREDEGPEASLLGWYAASRLVGLRESVPHLWDRAKPIVERAASNPGRLGFRARSELVDYLVNEESAEAGGGSFEKRTEETGGCALHARFAGPFGRLAPLDTTRHFDAEAAGPWPVTFTPDPARLVTPHVVGAKVFGCRLSAAEALDPGIYYVESFVTLPDAHDAIIVVEGASSVLVDDREVLSRDPDEWGSWGRFGVKIGLAAGRHRIVARIASTDTTIRAFDEQGKPLEATTSDDPAAPYALAPPTMLDDPNPLAPFLDDLGVHAVVRTATPSAAIATLDPHDPLLRFVAATLAHTDGLDDVADVLVEPLVKDGAHATGIALGAAANFVDQDPIFTPNDARDLALDLRTRAAAKDALLWYPRLWLALDEADKHGVTDVLPKLTDLASSFEEVPGIIKGLASTYARLGWKAEEENAILEAAKRFPDDTDVLRSELVLDDERGRFADADKVVARLRVLDPRGLIDAERAIRRGDYDAAVAALEAAKSAHPEDATLATRIEDLLTRAGRSKETFALLEKALASEPKSEKARLALADSRFAAGDKSALRNALVDAIRKGAPANGLRDAVELVEGLSELSPYRKDGLAIIREYESSGAAARGLASAAEPKGDTPPGAHPHGNAARVLDYSALFIRADGTARMLEHEILHIQSREGIAEQAEQPLPQGELLHIRTVKPDGTILEPEIVQGKPTVTMPHLEVGDYVDRETIYPLEGDGAGGRSFVAPRWFFREEKVDFYRSEFVIVSPKDKPLDVEMTGDVPAPTVKEDGSLVTRIYRVSETPAVPEERFRAPVEEFLPSVRVGWGVREEDTLARFVDFASAKTPRDPRLQLIAETIVAGDVRSPTDSAGKPPESDDRKGAVAKLSADEKAQRIYRWVTANVQKGNEGDARRVVTGKAGNRADAFLYLCRLVGVNVQRGLAIDRLAPPPTGPMSRAEAYSTLVVAVPVDAKATSYRYMIVGDKFAPYGFLPSSLRNQPVALLLPGVPRATTTAEGIDDGVADEGDVDLDTNGAATIALDETYSGRMAIELRSELSNIPDARVKEAVESQLLPNVLPGARLVSVDVKNLEDLDAPLTLAMKIEVSSFARPQAGGLRLPPTVRGRLRPLAPRILRPPANAALHQRHARDESAREAQGAHAPRRARDDRRGEREERRAPAFVRGERSRRGRHAPHRPSPRDAGWARRQSRRTIRRSRSSYVTPTKRSRTTCRSRSLRAELENEAQRSNAKNASATPHATSIAVANTQKGPRPRAHARRGCLVIVHLVLVGLVGLVALVGDRSRRVRRRRNVERALERVRECVDALESIDRILRERHHDDRRQRFRDVRIGSGEMRRDRHAREMCAEHLGHFAREGTTSRQHPVEEHADRVDVRAAVDRRARDLFWGHVLGRSHEHAGARFDVDAVRREHLGEPEVEHLFTNSDGLRI